MGHDIVQGINYNSEVCFITVDGDF